MVAAMLPALLYRDDATGEYVLILRWEDGREKVVVFSSGGDARRFCERQGIDLAG